MSVKKKTSGRRSVQADGEVSSQTTVERRSAEAELRKIIASLASAHAKLIGAVRKSLQRRLPTAHEVVYEYANLGAVVISFSPNERGYEGVLSIRADADGVRLYLSRGKELPDPAKLLQGSAQARWIDVEAASTLGRPEVARLLEEAIARNTVPFADAGRGSVVIRSTSTKKGRRPK
jgi:hypothetical protein